MDAWCSSAAASGRSPGATGSPSPGSLSSSAATERAATSFRLRTDRVDQQGGVTLRVDSVLRHLKVGRAHKGKRIRLYVADLDVRILTLDGELLRHLTIDPTSRYQGLDREVR